MKPRYLGKLDFTSGYHQALLALEFRILTAFLTFMGVHVWDTVPRSIERSRRLVSSDVPTTILASLIYITCESTLMI